MRTSGIVATMLALLASGCEPDAKSADWSLVFDPEPLGDLAVAVEASVVRGGCDGSETLWRSEVGSGESPPVLEAGEYGLAGRARDASCRWFASGCNNVTLPLGSDLPVRVVLLMSPSPTAQCEAERCVLGACVDRLDGGVDGGPSVDGGRGDSGGGCPDGYASCTGSCVDTDTDDAHCGACDSPCSGAEVCQGGACAIPCDPGEIDCGACVDPTIDPVHCGACGTTCGATEICRGGMCDCRLTETRCGSVCVDTQTDPANCGGCDATCPTDEMCSAGMCVPTCGTGETSCAGRCVNTNTSIFHCGMCDNACRGIFPLCMAGRCVCFLGGTTCSGVCVNLDTDEDNCGACGVVCSSGDTCRSGICGP